MHGTKSCALLVALKLQSLWLPYHGQGGLGFLQTLTRMFHIAA
jgi:hypothetical protein